MECRAGLLEQACSTAVKVEEAMFVCMCIIVIIITIIHYKTTRMCHDRVINGRANSNIGVQRWLSQSRKG